MPVLQEVNCSQVDFFRNQLTDRGEGNPSYVAYKDDGPGLVYDAFWTMDWILML